MINRIIPGSEIYDWREFRYIQGNNVKNFEKELFNKLFDSIENRLAKNGGVMSENCKITTPDNNIFYGLSYKGDIEGWRKDFECGAENLSLLFAKIEDNNLVDSLENKYPLSECKIEFY